MLRRLMLLALALCALVALESCGVNRLAGPRAADTTKSGAQDQPATDGGGAGDSGQDEQPVEGSRSH